VVGVGGRLTPLSTHYDKIVYLPSTTEDHAGSYLNSPGRSSIPASLAPWSSLVEKRFVNTLLEDLNKNLLAGRDSEPNLSRSATRPAMYTAMRTGSVESAVFVGSSNAEKLAVAASGLGLDVYKHTKGGWKLTKTNVDKLLPDLHDTLGSVPPDTPVVLFCLDNSCFFGLSEDGSMNPISKCVEGDDGFHVKGALVVAPDRSLKNVLEQQGRIIQACGEHPVFIISPWPRFVRCPCCCENEHVTNFSDPDFLNVILADLTKLRYHIRKVAHPVRVIDGLELICGSGYSRDRAATIINSCWHMDPVHPSKHTYAKMALNLLEKLAPQEKAAADTTSAQVDSSRKRTWSASNQSDAGSSGSSKRAGSGSRWNGGGGRPTPRSSSWHERKDSRRFSEGGYGRQGQQHPHFGYNDWDGCYVDSRRGRGDHHAAPAHRGGFAPGGQRGRRN
jgi:hypothetical protein